MKNIIIGAGLSGLSCAYKLKDAIVLEKDIAIGGLSKTLSFEGFSFDIGGHRFLPGKPGIEKFILSLLDGELIKMERKSQIYKNRRFFNYPITPDIVFQLNPLQIFASGMTFLYRKVAVLDENSFRERVINRFGDYLFNYFFKDYTEKVWGRDCSNISLDWVDARIGNMSLFDVASYIFSKKSRLKSFADMFYYPKTGIGSIAGRLSSGIDVRTSSAVVGLGYSGGHINEVVTDDNKRLPCDNLISTMPITELASMLNPPADVKRAIDALSYRDLICVFIIVEKNNYSDNHWIYFPNKEVFGRLDEPKNWSRILSSHHQTGLCLEIFTDRNSELWHRDDLEIAHAAVKDLPLINGVDIKDHYVLRVFDAYPVYDLHYKKHLAVVRKFLSGYKNLYTLGRTGDFKYMNMDDCIEQGLSLGERLPGSRVLEEDRKCK
ncbi:MAG: hypothetical protein C4533_00245 [Candidatus Omnitrophota bacterium]|jgi:protoporphyrinogen oxidase|nr:MAG: hypothetical protein C4533_00245 [Candidatus Omnitrophota bacterium]